MELRPLATANAVLGPASPAIRAAIGGLLLLLLRPLPRCGHLLVGRHEGGQLGGAFEQAAGGRRRLAGHPARVRVAKLAALLGAVPRHCHVREGAQVCKERERDNQIQVKATLFLSW